MSKSSELTAYQKLRAAWLWGGAGAVLCGGAAAMLAGEEYFGQEMVDDDEVELWLPRFRSPPRGLSVRRWRSAPESEQLRGMLATTPPRTAIDLARKLDSDVRSIAAMDSMCRTGGASPESIAVAAFAMKGQSGVRRVLELLASVDPRSESPKETELRLQLAGTDLPPLEAQVEVIDESGRIVARLDLGNREWKVGFQYDGEDHLKRERRDRDSIISARLASLGWSALRVTQGMLLDPTLLESFARDAFRRQGWTP